MCLGVKASVVDKVAEGKTDTAVAAIADKTENFIVIDAYSIWFGWPSYKSKMQTCDKLPLDSLALV